MKPPAFQFYAADFLVGTATMSAAAVGAYIRLLCYQWDTGGIPNDEATLCRLGGCDGIAVAEARLKFSVVDGVLKNARLEAEREKQRNYREKQAENGAKRWVGNAKPQGLAMPTHMPNACSPSPSPSPSLIAIPSARRPARRAAAVDDVGWVGSLKTNPAYTGIDVDREMAKAKTWAETHNRKFTRAFLVNWLNRAERPIAGTHDHRAVTAKYADAF